MRTGSEEGARGSAVPAGARAGSAPFVRRAVLSFVAVGWLLARTLGAGSFARAASLWEERYARRGRRGGKEDRERHPAVLRWAAGLAVALGAFLLYLRTLAPTVLPYSYPDLRDSGILQIKAALLSVPDVTGYPTWAVLTHLFTYLPFGDEAYRVNLASAVYAAVAVLLVFLISLRLAGRVAPAAAGALLFGVSQTFWSQAVVAEVYTLNALFVALVVLVLLVWRDEREDRYLLAAAFLMGLSLTHHLTSGLLLPAAALFVALVEWRKLLQWRLVLGGAGLFLLGLTPYLFLPIRGLMDPPFSGADPTTARGFYELVSGAGFKSVMFAFGPAELPGRLGMYLESLLEQFHPAFLVVALLGVAALMVRDRAALALTGFLYAGWLFYALEYDIGDVYTYFIPTYLIVCLWTAAGLGTLLGWAEEATSGLQGTARGAILAVLSVLALAAPLVGIGNTLESVDRSDAFEGRDLIETVEREARPDAVVLQHRSPLLYMQEVEGRRRDLTIASSPFPRLDGTLQNLDAPRRYLAEGRTVYVHDPHPGAVRRWEGDGYDLRPVEGGVLYEIMGNPAEG